MIDPAATPKAIVQPIRQEQTTNKVSFDDLRARAIGFILANPKRFIITSGVILFVLCNTAFLAFEQQKGFVNLG